jgi:hypothetical protein
LPPEKISVLLPSRLLDSDFTRAELADVVRKRRDFEYRLRRHSTLRQDFLAYELRLDSLRKRAIRRAAAEETLAAATTREAGGRGRRRRRTWRRGGGGGRAGEATKGAGSRGLAFFSLMRTREVEGVELGSRRHVDLTVDVSTFIFLGAEIVLPQTQWLTGHPNSEF